MDSFPGWRFRGLDYLSCATAGALAAGIAELLVPGGWPQPLGMLVGMAVGMLAVPPVILLAGFFSSIFEIVMPGMPAAMIAGMLATMRLFEDPTWIQTLGLGAAVGLVVQIIFHLHDRALRGEVRLTQK